MSAAARTRRRVFAPEVVQSSEMDCGPASLKCLLEGFGVPVSYGRLREACQTDIDGSSIDTMEDVARRLGLDAEQVMLPVDHVTLDASGALPAIAVVRREDGFNHFVVAWRAHTGRVQLMDPATGRRWTTSERFARDLYEHQMPVPAEAWLQWTRSDEYAGALMRRAESIGCPDRVLDALRRGAEASGSWRAPAALDAAVRMAEAIMRAGGVRRGRQATRLARTAFEHAIAPGAQALRCIPLPYWPVAAAHPAEDGTERVIARGAVLVRVRGRRREPTRRRTDEAPSETPLPVELEAALREKRRPAWRELLSMLRADGLLTPGALLLAIASATALIVLQALLLRSLLDLGRDLGLATQRAGAMALVALAAGAVLALEIPLSAGALRMGRRLELRIRVAFLSKIPRLSDRYFSSRLTSDMAERSHSAHGMRLAVNIGSQLLRSSFLLILTAVGIVWLDPASLPVAALAAVLSVVTPLALQPLLAERDLRLRTHAGGLTRFYLDAMLGLAAVRAAGGERAVRNEHERLLGKWASTGVSLQRAAVGVMGLQSLIGVSLSVWLVMGHAARAADPAGVLLLVYWALALPAYGEQLAGSLRQYPALRNAFLRVTEPLGAPEEEEHDDSGVAIETPAGPVELRLEGVTARIAGRDILRDVSIRVPPGRHVAVVGASGAGKSTLMGLLLGFLTPSQGAVLADGRPLRAGALRALRGRTVWVDPGVQLWNRSLLRNLMYGQDEGNLSRVGAALDAAELADALRAMPEGLQTRLGEGGSLVSGGEGQRVRFARGLCAPAPRLVILDEPFRGLDRDTRARMLDRARTVWRSATLVCVTHDVEETLAFDEVVVIDEGRVAESGSPADLCDRGGGAYRAMLDAERSLRSRTWADAAWRRLRMRDGAIEEEPA